MANQTYLDKEGLSYFWSKLKTYFAKIQVDTKQNWSQNLTLIPEKGELIVYSDYAQIEKDGNTINVPNFKIGDGLAYNIDLPFVGDDLREMLTNHVNNGTIHITAEERAFWNNKVRTEDFDIDNENLIFTIN